MTPMSCVKPIELWSSFSVDPEVSNIAPRDDVPNLGSM